MRTGADGFLNAAGRRLECAWNGPHPGAVPTTVLLHEGLGSVRQWRGLPAALARASGGATFAYSRAGYGASAPCALPRPLDYMHIEALEVLPEVLRAAHVREHVLFGHSDGASIAIIHAGGGAARDTLRGLVLVAPHLFTEAVGLAAIRRARQAYAAGDLRGRLARYHGRNVDIAFDGWADAWTSPGFLAWNIEAFLPRIRVPILLVQGEADEYGTLAQVRAVEQQAGGPAQTLLLPGCGHSPHLERAAELTEAAAAFVRRVCRS